MTERLLVCCPAGPPVQHPEQEAVQRRHARLPEDDPAQPASSRRGAAPCLVCYIICLSTYYINKLYIYMCYRMLAVMTLIQIPIDSARPGVARRPSITEQPVLPYFARLQSWDYRLRGPRTCVMSVKLGVARRHSINTAIC